MTERAAGAAEPYWFDARALTEKPEKAADQPDSARQRFRTAWAGGSLKDRVDAVRGADLKGMASDWWADAVNAGRALERFAEANGLEYLRQKYDREWIEGEALPGMIFRGGERRDMVTWGDPVAVEFGNWSSSGQELVLAYGYIAVRHDLGLPHIVIDSRANDTTPPPGSGLYAKKADYSSLSMNYRGSGSTSPMGRIRHSIEPLDLGIENDGIENDGAENDAHFRAYCDRGQAASARAFLTEDTLRMLRGVSMSFDIEITEDWIYLYAYDVEVSWRDPERWAWVFSVASRLWDWVEFWRASAGRPPAEARPPFYTDRLVERSVELGELPKPSPGWQAFWDLGDPHM